MSSLPHRALITGAALLLAACPADREATEGKRVEPAPTKKAAPPSTKKAAPDIPSKGPLAQKIYYEQAKGLLRGGRVEESAEAFRRAIAAQEEGKLASNCYLGLGSALGELGQRSAAVAAYRKVVALSPRDPDAYRALAIGLEELGRLDEAAATLRQSLQLDPDQLTAYQDLASLFLRQKDQKNARTVFMAYEQRRATLIKLLGLSRNPEEREAAAALLGQARDESTAKALGLALGDKDARVRMAVIVALGQQGLKAGAGPLKAMLEQTKDAAERKAIQRSLESIAAAVQPAPVPPVPPGP